MTQQYLRSLSLTVSGKGNQTQIATYKGGVGLRVRFEISQAVVGTPQSAVITITNLSAATAQKIENEYEKVVLQVGYGDNLATLFEGDIKQRTGNGTETPTDTYFKIVAAAGQTALNYSVISKTLAAGHTFKDQVTACLQALAPFGIVAGYIDNLGSVKMPRGKVLFGMTREVLHDIGAATGSSWWIDGNKLNVVKDTGSIPGNVTVLNSATGMIGIPVQTIQGIQVRCLINTNIKPGTLIKLNDADIQKYVTGTGVNDQATAQQVPSLASEPKAGEFATDGIYKVISLSSIGDTRGTEWYNDIICISAGSNGSVSIPLAARGVTGTN